MLNIDSKIMHITKQFFLLCVFFLLGNNYCSALDVNAGGDIIADSASPSDITLNGSISGLGAGCNVNYEWREDTYSLMINQQYLLNGAFIHSSNIASSPGNYRIDLNVDAYGCDDTLDDGLVTDSLNICIKGSGITCEKETSSGGRSSFEISREQAKKLFKDKESISKLKINLEEKKSEKGVYKIGWNYLGGIGHVNYEILYSSGINFDKYKKYEIKSNFKMFLEEELGEENLVYFFKVRGYYNDLYTDWSNILAVTNKDSPLNIFKFSCKNCNKKVSFKDIFDTVESLIDKVFPIECKNCRRNVRYNDIMNE